MGWDNQLMYGAISHSGRLWSDMDVGISERVAICIALFGSGFVIARWMSAAPSFGLIDGQTRLSWAAIRPLRSKLVRAYRLQLSGLVTGRKVWLIPGHLGRKDLISAR